MLPALAYIEDDAVEAACVAVHSAKYAGAVGSPAWRRANNDKSHAQSLSHHAERARWLSSCIAQHWADLPLVVPLATAEIEDHCRSRLRRRERALEAARDLESWARHYDSLARRYSGPHWLFRDVARRHAAALRREAAKAVEPHGLDYYQRWQWGC